MSTAGKQQSIFNNHPFHYHIAAIIIALLLGALLFQFAFIYLSVDTLSEKIAYRLAISALLIIAISIPVAWHVSRRISGQLDILKKQASAIRVFDFDTDVELDTPIREIFGLGRAMKQMRTMIKKFMHVSLALSGERNFGKLLGRVIHEMREACDGDGGVIYLYEGGGAKLRKAAHRWTKTGPQAEPAEEMPLSDQNHPVNMEVLRSRTPSLHTIAHPRPAGLECLDQRYGAETVQMVVVPLRSSDDTPIGVVLSFMVPGATPPSHERMALAEAFSSAAAIAIDQQRLMERQKILLDSMIQIIASAIDAKSPYTGGHCARVPELALMLAQEACKVKEGPLADFEFRTDDEWREFKVGAWLHDCGKVATPGHVVDKATKLETVFNRIHEIRTRFEVLLRDAEIERMQAIHERGIPRAEAGAAYEKRKAELTADFAFVAESNIGGEFMSPDKIERLNKIAQNTWLRNFDDRLGLSYEELRIYEKEPAAPLPALEHLLADKPHHLVEHTASRADDPKYGFRLKVPEYQYNHGELHNLGIGRGTLSEEERYKINEHTIHTIHMLEQMPLPENLKRIPEYAGTHHETLTGSGYPRKLEAKDLSVPSKIMAIADIFEALTACDRPYKKAKPLSEAVKILSFFKKDGHIDPMLFDLFLTTGTYKTYAVRYLRPEQIDEVDISKYLG